MVNSTHLIALGGVHTTSTFMNIVINKGKCVLELPDLGKLFHVTELLKFSRDGDRVL